MPEHDDALRLGSVPIYLAREQLSRAYVQAVVSVARCTFTEERPDVHGIDMHVTHQFEVGKGQYDYRFVDIQIKASGDSSVQDEIIAYRLEKNHYDKLRPVGLSVPRILVVVAVPDGWRDWILATEQSLAIKKCAYWISLEGYPETEQETVTVSLPRRNIFGVEALCEMMKRQSEGLPLSEGGE